MATSSSMWMIMLAVFLILSEFEAKEHLVGDSESSWLLPLSQAHCLMIGDSLSWKYDEGSETPVLQVKEEHYHNCNKSNPIQGYVINNGHVRVVLNKPGPFYFISGTQDNCELGLKLHVRVLSDIDSLEGCPTCGRDDHKRDHDKGKDGCLSCGPFHPPGNNCPDCHNRPVQQGQDCPDCHKSSKDGKGGGDMWKWR